MEAPPRRRPLVRMHSEPFRPEMMYTRKPSISRAVTIEKEHVEVDEVEKSPSRSRRRPKSLPYDISAEVIHGLETERKHRRRRSVQEAFDFLNNFLEYHYAEHPGAENVRVNCEITLDELKMIGNDNDSRAGTKQCQRLFCNAPVLSEEIGYLLWQELKAGEGLDHSHRVGTDAANCGGGGANHHHRPGLGVLEDEHDQHPGTMYDTSWRNVEEKEHSDGESWGDNFSFSSSPLRPASIATTASTTFSMQKRASRVARALRESCRWAFTT